MALVAKTTTALGSPTGEPPAQLPELDQRSLTAPVHWWEVGVRRASRASSRGRNVIRGRWRCPRARPAVETCRWSQSNQFRVMIALPGTKCEPAQSGNRMHLLAPVATIDPATCRRVLQAIRRKAGIEAIERKGGKIRLRFAGSTVG